MNEAFAEMEPTSENKVSLQNFIKWHHRNHPTKPSHVYEQIKSLFSAFDVDQNGFLTVDEVQKLLKNTGNKITGQFGLKISYGKKSFHEVFESLDVDGDGMVTLDNFMKWHCNQHGIPVPSPSTSPLSSPMNSRLKTLKRRHTENVNNTGITEEKSFGEKKTEIRFKQDIETPEIGMDCQVWSNSLNTWLPGTIDKLERIQSNLFDVHVQIDDHDKASGKWVLYNSSFLPPQNGDLTEEEKDLIETTFLTLLSHGPHRWKQEGELDNQMIMDDSNDDYMIKSPDDACSSRFNEALLRVLSHSTNDDKLLKHFKNGIVPKYSQRKKTGKKKQNEKKVPKKSAPESDIALIDDEKKLDVRLSHFLLANQRKRDKLLLRTEKLKMLQTRFSDKFENLRNELLIASNEQLSLLNQQERRIVEIREMLWNSFDKGLVLSDEELIDTELSEIVNLQSNLNEKKTQNDDEEKDNRKDRIFRNRTMITGAKTNFA
eukprot:g4128.t1